MRVGFVSQYYPPEPGAAAHPGVVATALSRRGHDVRVLTGFPSYPEGVIYDGYVQRPRMNDRVDGVALTRVPYFLSHDASGSRRALSMLSFGASSALQSRVLRGSDVVLAYASPATTAMPAMLARIIGRIPYVMSIQDLWPDTVLESGMLAENPGLRDRVERTLSLALGRAYRSARRIVVISDSMKTILTERGVPADKLVVVPNWVDEAVLAPAAPDAELAARFEKDALTVMYAGGIGELQGLQHAVAAMRVLGRNAGIRLVILGEGVAKQGLQDQVRAGDLDDVVTFLPGRALNAMPAAIAAADVQLVSLLDRPLFHGTIPSKVQATMCLGEPLLVSAPGDAATMVVEAGAGFSVPPESPPALAQAMLRLRDLGPDAHREMGLRGREFYAAKLSEQAGVQRLEATLAAAIG